MADDARTSPILPSRDIARLIDIMAALRTPGTGCPWDLEQTFESIAPYTIEEAYEVADAIARGDLTDLQDELGDLLLQVVYHARIAEERHAFSFGDVVQTVTAKMIRRHPHVFGDGKAESANAVNHLWDTIKSQERAAKPATVTGVLSDVPVGLPALTRAIKLQNKAAKVGFDWPTLAPVFDKMREELAELEAAMLMTDRAVHETTEGGVTGEGFDAGASHRAHAVHHVEEEFGDLLFVMANVARHLDINAENALQAANRKFIRRFEHIEKRLAESGTTPAGSTLAEMDALWDEIRAAEKKLPKT